MAHTKLMPARITKRVWFGAAAVVLVTLGVTCLWPETNLAILKIALLCDRSAGWNITQLSQSERGVEIASRYIHVAAGSAGGWSTAVLLQSHLSEHVHAILDEIIRDESAQAGRRMEACFILWTREHDPEYLRHLFNLVREPGGPVINFGRRRLGIAFAGFDERRLIETPNSGPIPLTADDFAVLLHAIATE